MKKFTDHKLKMILFAGILTLTLVAAGSVLAQGPGQGNFRGQGKGMMGRGMGPQNCLDGGPGFRSEFRMERMAARLDLTEDQVEAITKIREDGRTENLEIQKQTLRLRNELRGEMLKDDPSQKTVLDLNSKLGQLRTERQANRLENRLAVREQLTPEQRDRMLLMGDFGKMGRGGQKGFRGAGRGAARGNFGNGGPGGPGQGYGRGFQGDF
ncbi:MAG: Spy/CpxP family protein refolding chaperone [Gemmatimonadales bacterium]|nr:Spy/CpxP family protein refolding chaperone [Gemmatimonadales bacterium]